MPRKPQAGVCIVRAEIDRDRLLITIVANTSTTRTLRLVEPLPTRHFVDVDGATEAVADFLRRFLTPASDELAWPGTEIE